jgi:signal transduction histidine kinase/streptogramin lyase
LHPKKYYTIYLLAGLLATIMNLTNSAIGQNIVSSNNMEAFMLNNYNRTDGLTNNLCTYMYCDRRGMVWIGSDEGLSIFDGSRFRKFFLGIGPVELSGDRIVFITEDSLGNVWIVSANSIDCYNPNTHTTRNYPFFSTSQVSPPSFRNIFIKQGEPVWVFTTQGLFLLDPVTGTYTLYSKQMPKNKTLDSNIFYDGWVFDRKKNQLWIGAYAGVGCYDFNTRTFYNKEHNPEGLPVFYCRPAKSSFKQSPGGTIYFVDRKTNNLASYHPNSKTLKYYPLPQVNEKTLDYFALHIPPDGSIWMGLRSTGVFILDTLSGKYTELSNTEKYNRQVTSNYIWHIANDYQGNVWISHGMGAAVVARQPFKYESILGSTVIKELSRLSRLEQIHIDEAGNIWTAANKAHIAMFNPKTGIHKTFSIPGGDSISLSGILPFSQDKFILSGNEGLWEFSKITQKFRRLLQGKKGQEFNHSSFRRKPMVLPDGTMAFPDADGVFLYNPQKESATILPYYFFSKNDSARLSPTCIASNGKGGLLVGFETDKLSLFNWDPVSNQVIALHKRLDSSVVANIKPLIGAYMSSDGSLFVTDRVFGFWKIDRDFKKIRHFSRKDGMLTNIVIDFARAENGDIWIQTFTGISCLRAKTGKIESFEPGYPDMGSFYFAFHLDTLRKKLYISDVNNIRIIDYQTFASNAPNFKSGIIEIRVNGVRRALINGHLPDLRFDENNITVDFGTFNFFPNAQTDISYTLSNNPIPVKIDGSRQINLSGLKSGRYTLTIEASGQYGKKSQPIFIHFNIHPAWYNTWWFLIICFVLSVAFIWYAAKLAQKEKLRKLEQQNEIFRLKAEQLSAIANERERITADLHDDVGATLSSLNIYGDLAHSIWENNPKKSKEIVSKMAIQSRELLFRMSDIIWSMKTEEAGSSGLMPRIKNFAQELLSGKGIEVGFVLDESTMAAITNPMCRKNIILIVKESLNNVAKYSEATKATILLEKRGEILHLEIEDDGKGFDAELQKEGNGLENMATRCRQMGGFFDLVSQPGKGTTITCRIPLAIISYSGNE